MATRTPSRPMPPGRVAGLGTPRSPGAGGTRLASSVPTPPRGATGWNGPAKREEAPEARRPRCELIPGSESQTRCRPARPPGQAAHRSRGSTSATAPEAGAPSDGGRRAPAAPRGRRRHRSRPRRGLGSEAPALPRPPPPSGRPETQAQERRQLRPQPGSPKAVPSRDSGHMTAAAHVTSRQVTQGRAHVITQWAGPAGTRGEVSVCSPRRAVREPHVPEAPPSASQRSPAPPVSRVLTKRPVQPGACALRGARPPRSALARGSGAPACALLSAASAAPCGLDAYLLLQSQTSQCAV